MACLPDLHYNDVIMSAMASQLTSPTIVYSIFYSGADQRKPQSTASLAFVSGIHRWPAGLDIRKFHPWFNLQPKFHYRNHNISRNTFPSHLIFSSLLKSINTSLTITVHYTSESLVNEWPFISLYAICYSFLFEDKNITVGTGMTYSAL